MIAHVEKTNAGNKRSFSEVKIDDTVTTQQKRQRDMGRYEAMINFDEKAKIKLTWLALIFEDAKGGGEEGKADSTDDVCHCQKELSSELCKGCFWPSDDFEGPPF